LQRVRASCESTDGWNFDDFVKLAYRRTPIVSGTASRSFTQVEVSPQRAGLLASGRPNALSGDARAIHEREHLVLTGGPASRVTLQSELHHPRTLAA
jgi:hypothetical protein